VGLGIGEPPSPVDSNTTADHGKKRQKLISFPRLQTKLPTLSRIVGAGTAVTCPCEVARIQEG
jgi:hypothetical protein